ncbi:Hypothetical predicted protein, partial [Scomber scombrus]
MVWIVLASLSVLHLSWLTLLASELAASWLPTSAGITRLAANATSSVSRTNDSMVLKHRHPISELLQLHSSPSTPPGHVTSNSINELGLPCRPRYVHRGSRR